MRQVNQLQKWGGFVNPREPFNLASIASRAFINRYRETRGKFPSAMHYDHFMMSFHRDDIQGATMVLPCCWFRSGHEVLVNLLSGVQLDHEDVRFATVQWRGSVSHDADASVFIASAEKFAERFISKYSIEEEEDEAALMDSHDRAPYEFLREFDAMGETLEVLSSKGEGSFEGRIPPLFLEVMGKFPSDFSHLSEYVELFSKVFSLSLGTRASLSFRKELLDAFWTWFCYHLRIKCNRNIPQAVIEEWRGKIPWENEMYSRNLQDAAFELTGDESTDLMIVKTLERRRKRMVELEMVLNYFSDDLMDGFEEFIRNCR